MFVKWAVLGAAGLVAVLFSTAATAAEPLDVAREMDRYVENPRSPGAYRALSNLGDPDFGNASTYNYYDWEDTSDARELFDLDWGGDCRTDYAVKTYRERVAKLGAGSPYVKHWVNVQRAVFSACKGWGNERHVRPLPGPLPLPEGETARLQRADRAYQAASQLFYQSKIAEARAAFATIAQQSGPHRSTAAYMIASIDAGSRSGQPEDPRPGAIREARSLLTDSKTRHMRTAAHELIGWMGATANTRETRAAQVAVTLEALHLPFATLSSDEQARGRYDRAVQDLPRLSTNFDNTDWWLTGAIPGEYFGSQAMAKAARTDRLAAFSLLPARCENSPCDTYPFHDFVRTQYDGSEKAGDRDAWRVAQAELIGGYDQEDFWGEIDDLIGRVERFPTDHDVALLALLANEQLHRAFAGVKYDEKLNRLERQRGIALMTRWPWPQSTWFAQRYSSSLQTLANLGHLADARALRDRVGSRLPDGVRYYAPGDLLLILAEDRDHFVQAMVQQGQTSSALIDRLPVRELEALARDDRIAQRDRARFARVAWTRSYLLDKRMPKDLDQLMRSLNPELAQVWKSRIGAKTSDHALLLDLLRTPGMNLRAASRAEGNYDGSEQLKLSELDVYQHSLNNWWCGPIAVEFNERDEDVLFSGLGQGGARPAAERLLAESWAWQALDREDRAALGKHAMAPRSMAEAAVAWGQRANPKHPGGADEALALAVRATRYGCQFQGGHGQWSKAAWDLLHQRFPDTDAARRTRWWFDCKHFTYGCSDSNEDDQSSLPWPDLPPDPTAPARGAEEAGEPSG